MRGPAMAPLNMQRGGGGGGGGGGEEQQAERWRHFDNSVNAVSFGFVATAILISMFLVMAIFERFLRPRAPFLSSSDDDHHRHHDGDGGRRGDREAQRRNYSAKLDYPSPKMSIYAKGVSVLMPGNDIPTFIAHPAPVPCPPERISWPPHQNIPIGGSSSVSS
ncbi:uncharacterized protein M6B38_104155 [Iris pallida]|uniref:Uncharacterized protein n=1 Tax=Iris pallida TaxID=29817 RepID=A0AAX6F2W3_IRIPA|nr:uncharacterized protein M6B38_104155 [Iris pallida]